MSAGGFSLGWRMVGVLWLKRRILKENNVPEERGNVSVTG